MKIKADNNATLGATLDSPNFEIIQSLDKKVENAKILYATWTRLVDADNDNAHFNIGVNVIIDTKDGKRSLQARFCGLQESIVKALKEFRLLNGDNALAAGEPFLFTAKDTLISVSHIVTSDVTTASGNTYKKITENVRCNDVVVTTVRKKGVKTAKKVEKVEKVEIITEDKDDEDDDE